MTTHDHPTTADSFDHSRGPVEGQHPMGQEMHSGVQAQPPAGEHATPADAPTAPAGVAQPSNAPAPEAGREQHLTSPPVAPAEPSTGAVHRGSGEPQSSTEQALFADDELEELRGRWTAVQSAFVDDPKECVQKADVLVSDLVEQLTSGFASARARLEEQWARGEQASTEDLRVALMHYREFFERLLAV
jgi:hypothetical protein